MAYYFDVISCGIKQMHAQFSLLFRLHNAMDKTEHCWRQPREDTREKLDGNAFQLYKQRLCRFKQSVSI